MYARAALTLLGAASLFSSAAHADPHRISLGALAPDFTVEDADGRRDRLANHRGSIVVIIDEPREASDQNAEFKGRLAALGPKVESRLTWLAIADVSRYAFWPARNYVKAALREAGAKDASTIWADWQGVVRRLLGLRGDQSAVIILDGEGRVRFAHEGSLGEAGVRAAFEVLRGLGVPINADARGAAR